MAARGSKHKLMDIACRSASGMDPEVLEIIEEYCPRCASGRGECLAEMMRQAVSHEELSEH
jgi:hypothetical protein